MPLLAVLFDLWGTLLHVEDPADSETPRRRFRQRLADALAEVDRPYDDDVLAAALERFGEEQHERHERGVDISHPERVARILGLLDQALPGRLSREALATVEDAVALAGTRRRLFAAPGATEAIAAVRRRGLVTSLISNTGMTPGYALRQVMEREGLLAGLDLIFFSDEAGSVKPAPAMFEAALDALGVAPAEAAFVGDSPELDIAGASGAGLWSVLLGDREVAGITPDIRIATLHELSAALEGLG